MDLVFEFREGLGEGGMTSQRGALDEALAQIGGHGLGAGPQVEFVLHGHGSRIPVFAHSNRALGDYLAAFQAESGQGREVGCRADRFQQTLGGQRGGGRARTGERA